jgi:hypothetical protein
MVNYYSKLINPIGTFSIIPPQEGCASGISTVRAMCPKGIRVHMIVVSSPLIA